VPCAGVQSRAASGQIVNRLRSGHSPDYIGGSRVDYEFAGYFRLRYTASSTSA
jgi:hypothetical protein